MAHGFLQVLLISFIGWKDLQRLISKVYKRKFMQDINVAGKDCINLFVNTHAFLTFISLNIHIMFSLRTNSRIFESPHTHFRISFGQDFGVFVFVNKTTTITVWDLNLHAIKSYLTLSMSEATIKTLKRLKH